MIYQGRVRNGVVVLDGETPAEGTLVRVEPVGPTGTTPGSPAAVMRVAGTWAGDASEADRLLAELREMKQSELDVRDEADGDPLRP